MKKIALEMNEIRYSVVEPPLNLEEGMLIEDEKAEDKKFNDTFLSI